MPSSPSAQRPDRRPGSGVVTAGPHSANKQRGVASGETGMAAQHVLAIDQGTTSTRAILFDRAGLPVGRAQREFAQHYPSPAGSSTIPRDLGGHARGPRAALAAGAASPRRTSPRSASPTSARPSCCGTARPARRSTARSSGRTGAPPSCAAGWSPTATRSWCARAPGWSSTPISRRPSSPGCSTRCRARAPRPSAASSPSARSTASCCGG